MIREYSLLAALTEQAIEHHNAGRLFDAEAKYRQALILDGEFGDALQGLGILKWQHGDIEEAICLLRRNTRIHPQIWRYAFTLARFFSENGYYSDAVPAFQAALQLQPESIDSLFGLANALYTLERFDEAVNNYENIVARQPDNVQALNNLGLAFDKLGRSCEAIEVYQRAIRIETDYLPLYNNLGNAYLGVGQVDEAIAVFKCGLKLDSGSADLWCNYANALAMLSASADAEHAYQQALAIDREHVSALVNCGNLKRQQGQYEQAMVLYNQAIRCSPDSFDAYNNLGVALSLSGRLDEAILVLERALKLEPNATAVYNNLGNFYKDAGEISRAIDCYRQALVFDEQNTEAHSNLIYALSFLPGSDDRDLLREAEKFAGLHYLPKNSICRWRINRDRRPEKRLRIGYVSPDFRRHCQAQFTAPLFANHDHIGFEIYCYAHLALMDDMSRQLADDADVWRMTYGKSDAQVAEMIVADGVDILVDLTMHMANGRPLLFARKPAPVQVAWLAYPGTTGLPAMDYRLTDPWLDQPSSGGDCYSECSIRLPETFWCYDPLVAGMETNALPVLTADCITFGCLNNFCKVSEASLRSWGRIMSRVTGSRLVLLAAAGRHRQRVTEVLGGFGIEPSRIEFVEYRPRSSYLQTYHRIDICLDTLPYNGHTTSLDAFWMGVPVVTQVGNTVVGRAGWSQLNNLDLTELAAFDEQSFVDIAVGLADNLPRLAEMRGFLRRRMQNSPLMDGKRFATGLEAVYRQIWQTWCCGQSVRDAGPGG